MKALDYVFLRGDRVPMWAQRIEPEWLQPHVTFGVDCIVERTDALVTVQMLNNFSTPYEIDMCGHDCSTIAEIHFHGAPTLTRGPACLALPDDA